ncbi:MAG: Transglutaminase-like superfamily protein [Syntrophaceae bacterium PtaB.Bin038]|nr:MAG: Transglutaminase-like superfamily protein [Syntrophaceae bacterium PtaB.Bin038]
MRDGILYTVRKTGSEVTSAETTLREPLYPAAAINLYPVLKGLAVGLKYRYDVYDPQTQSVTAVSQTVAGFESSRSLGVEPSWKVETSMLGQNVETWINRKGEAVFELGMKGVLITHRETENEARRYLTEASLNKKDLILDYSVVKTEKPLACPREATLLDISLAGIAGELPLLQGPGQEASQGAGDAAAVTYRIRRNPDSPARISGPRYNVDSYRWVLPASQVESDHPEIVNTAREVTRGLSDPLAKVRKLASWVAETVKDEPVDSFSALEVLRTKKGECQAHTMLYTALARAVGIPTRMAGGLVYMEGVGFLYHAWAESDAGGWVSVDPTFDQVGVDATHIKLVEGPGWLAIVPLGRVVGRVTATVIDYKAACRP